jgi:hypothetical protein
MSFRKRILAAIERFQPVSMALADALGGLPADGGTLVVANGSSVGLRSVLEIATRRTVPITFFADSQERRRQLESAARPGDTVVTGPPLALALPQGLGFVAILSGPGQMRDVLEEYLFERLPDALLPGAIVAVQVFRDAEAVSGTATISRDAADKTADFLMSQFGATQIDGEMLRARFADCPQYEYIGWAPRAGSDAATDAAVWLVLRRKPDTANRPAAPAQPLSAEASPAGFPRTPRAGQFLLSDFEALIAAMREVDIRLIPVDRFAKRLRRLVARPALQNTGAFGMVKFDIHGNIQRPLEMAKILKRHNAFGLFLMMPRHPLNEAFYDSPSTWRTLKEIRDMGHEIGLHPDVFHLCATYGDLYAGLDATLSDFRAKGFEIRCATLHGDTRTEIKSRGLQANDFFHDGVRKTKWDGKLPTGLPELGKHIGAYSHAKMAQDYGIVYSPEVNFLQAGELIAKYEMHYLSDNQRAFALKGSGRGDQRMVCPQRYRLTPEFLQEAVAQLLRSPFLALFHPQWYW